MVQNFNDIRPSAKDLKHPPTQWALENTRVQKALGISPHQYDAYRVAVGQIESGNNPNMGAGGAGGHYWGPYQFGTAATVETSKFLGEKVQKQQFKGNQALAERHFDAYSYLNHQTLMRLSPRYRGMSPGEKLGALGYAHNQGAGGASKWLATGVEGRDAFGTSGAKYFHAILNGLKKIGEFIWNGVKAVGEFIFNGVKAVGDAIGGAFTPQPQSPQPPHPQQPHHQLHHQPQPAPQKPNGGLWQFNMSPDPPYAPFQPPVRPGLTPERGTLPNNGWVNNRPMDGQVIGNPVQSNIVMGDSIGVSMKSQYPAAQNVAVGGVSIANAIPQLSRVARGSVADVYLGTNNHGYSDQAIQQQTQDFLKKAEASGVHINNWILPAHHAKSPKKDEGLKRVGDIITQTIREYNEAHPGQRPIQTVVTRDKGIALEQDGYHLTPTGNMQVKTLVAQQTHSPRPAYVAAQQAPAPASKKLWNFGQDQPPKTV